MRLVSILAKPAALTALVALACWGQTTPNNVEQRPRQELFAPAVTGQFEPLPVAVTAPAPPLVTTESEAKQPDASPGAAPTVEPAPPPAAPLPEGCRPLTDKAMAVDLKAATAQSQKRDLSEQLKLVNDAVALWTAATEQCDGRARERAQRNLADNLKAQERLSEQQGSGPKCESAHRDASSLQDLARQALSERRFSEAAALFRKAEDAWENAAELCTGSQQETANRRRDQSEVDGHNAEYCAPVFERAREQTLRLRNTPVGTPREEKQEISMGAETLWRDAASHCKGSVVDTARNQAQTIARERGTPWVSRYPAGTQAPKPLPVQKPATPVLTAGATANQANAKQDAATSGDKSTAATALSSLTTAIGSIGKSVTSAGTSLVAAVPVAATAPQPTSPQAQPGEFVSGTTRFVGKFVRDADSPTYSGTGKLTWENGDTFDGSLLKSQRHGRGQFVWANGQTYDGDWENDKPVGRAKMKFANGNQYDGLVSDGIPHGQGQMRYASGDTYAGQFRTGVPHGRGIYAWKNGQQYDGEWENDLPQGQGKLRFANGNVYEGTLVKGVPNGQGRTAFASGEIYAGQVVNGLPDGQGTFTWPTGDKYIGQWKAGKKHGAGVFTWKSGDRWEGIYENDQQTDKPLGQK